MKGILFLQSEYSLLQSLIKLENLFIEAKNNDYTFLALSDDTLYGSYELFELAKKYQIKPILGMYINVNIPYETNFLVYVKNQIGYQNLLKLNLLKEANVKISLDDLIMYQQGLIFVTAGFNSIIDQTVMFGNEYEVINYIKEYQKYFDSFYVGLANNYSIQQKVLKPFLINLQKSNNFNIVPLHQTNYLNESQRLAYETLLKINNQNNIVDSEANFRFLTKDDLASIPIYQLNEFLNSISFDLKFPKYEMPKYLEDEEAKLFLRQLANKGLERRLKLNNIKDSRLYIERLNYELDIIISKNFTNYFLIVYDFIKYAKTNNILVGPGRGSASGALVSYALGITEVDPIKYNLLFERFLNVERMSMPDIDIDFPDNKRDEVINYVKDKYGENHIVSITTYDTFQQRSSIRDVARTLNIPPHRVNGIIQAVLSKRIDKSDELVNKVLTVSKEIEGLIRHTGTHAAGIILANQSLKETLPLKSGSYNFYQAGYDAQTLEKLGLYKIDFLGIRNLTIIHDVILELKQRDIEIDINNLPLDDKKTYELLSKGDTTGIFQLESTGMRKVLQKLKPENFEDIVATLALFRPGPMANIDVYIDRKNGRKFNYLHEDLKDILMPTYGIIIYQEQIMQIANKFAGMSMLEADNLRVGISKKDINVLEEVKQKFITGAINNGYSEELTNEIYSLILKFADYGFNRSHSVSYSLVAYQMAYLKANYYFLFMKVLLNNVIGNKDQTSEYIKELKTNNIEVIIPSINYSGNNYLIRQGKLLMPLTQIRGVGTKVYETINEERRNGLFTSYNDLKSRLSNKINETQLSNLIHAGALDEFGYNRQTLISNINLESSVVEQFIKDFVIRDVEEYSFTELQANEANALGLNIKYDFVSLVKSKGLSQNTYLVSEIEKSKRKEINVIGIIKTITKHTTKQNQAMLFVTITDLVAEIDVTIFPKDVDNFQGFKVNDRVVLTVYKDLYNNKTVYNFSKIKLY